MRDVEVYRHLMGLEEPWTVRSVELKVAEQRVDVWAGHGEGVRWPCPECGTELALYDHAEERVWRHLDSCQFLTYLHAPPPRVECPTHGVRQVRLPWVEARVHPAHRPEANPARGARALAAVSEDCGVRFVSQRTAEADLLRSALLAFEN